MFIQICPNTSDDLGICCYLNDLSPDDGERFLLGIEGEDMDTEVGRVQDNKAKSEHAEFLGLIDRQVYVINAYIQKESGWEKVTSCKAVPAKMPVRKPLTTRERGQMEEVLLPPAGINLGSLRKQATITVEKVEVE